MTRRIAFIESANEMGGVEFSTLYLASFLDPDRWDVTVICPGEGSLASACRAAGVRVETPPLPVLASTSFRVGKRDTRLPNILAWLWNGFCIILAVVRLRRVFPHIEPELIVTKGLYAHFAGGIAAKLAHIRCVWHVQDFISERFGGLYRILFGLVVSLLADEVIADGTPIVRQLPERIKPRVHVLLNGVDVQTFRPCRDAGAVRLGLGIPADALVIGHAARLTPWKGQHHLLEAFARIARRHPHARLLLVGSPLFDDGSYERNLRQRTEELGLAARVIFAGFRTDLPQVLNAMDIFAYPSVEKDTSPLALLSALACGLPVIAFDIDGVREVLDGSGILVPVGDERRLADELERLLEDAPLRGSMGEQSREEAVKRFSLEMYASGMETVFSLRSGWKRIFFVHSGNETFVKIDRDLLRASFEVQEFHSARKFPASLGRYWRGVSQSDAVFCWFASWNSLWALLLAKLVRKPSVLVIGGYDVSALPETGYGSQRGGMEKLVSRLAMHLADRLLPFSDFSQMEAERNAGTPGEKMQRIYLGVPDPFGELPSAARGRIALTVGNVELPNLKRKGLELFVRAAALLPDVQFVLVGAWKDDSIVYLRSIASPNVSFTGRVSDEELCDYYRKAAVYVQASLHEGFGLSVAEAMLAGCIPVVTGAGSLPEVVGDCGYYCESNSAEAVAGGIRSALNSSLSERARARERILTEFPLEKRKTALVQVVQVCRMH